MKNATYLPPFCDLVRQIIAEPDPIKRAKIERKLNMVMPKSSPKVMEDS